MAQICTHLAHTHFFVETFALAMHRCLMPSHPLHKMLKEHFRFIVSIIISFNITISSRFIISIDTLGRQVLIAPDGSADLSLTIGHGSEGVKELLAKTYKRMDWKNFDYVERMKRRGMMDLPGYHHRDDCLLLWDVIKKYVEKMVNAFYEDDYAVVDDWELQNWAKEVYKEVMFFHVSKIRSCLRMLHQVSSTFSNNCIRD